jgi:tetratricopeptide (TPR) repeat protein
MSPAHLIIVAATGAALLGGPALPAHADGSVTVIGTSPLAACSAAAAQAKRTGIGSRGGLEACGRAIEAWPSPQFQVATAYVNRSVIRLVRDDVVGAEADAGAAIRLDGTIAEAYLDRGIALSAQHRCAEAMGDFAHALSLRLPRPELAYFDRAVAREDSGDIKGAYFDYRQAANINPGWEEPRHELARFRIRTTSN